MGRYTRKARPDLVVFLRTRRSIKFRSYGPLAGADTCCAPPPHHAAAEGGGGGGRGGEGSQLSLAQRTIASHYTCSHFSLYFFSLSP